MRRMRTALLCAALAATGCSAVLKFHECDSDNDCLGRADGGGTLYCTDDHMCVGAVPDYKLCAVEEPASGVIPDGALVVGGLYRVSGSNDVNDHAFRNAANLAAAEIFQAGYPIAHVVCDTNGDPAQALRAYKVVIERFHADVVVGPDTSDEVFEVAKVVKAWGVPFMSPSATNPRITDLDDDGLIWRAAASDNLQAKVLAQLPGGSRVDIVYVNSAYASGLEQAFASNFPAKQIGNAISFTSGDGDSIANSVQAVTADAPPYVLLIADFDAPPLLNAVSQAGAALMSTQLLMTDSAKKPSLWGQLSSGYAVLQRVHGTGPANPAFSDPSGMAFSVLSTNYKARFMGEDPAETAFVSNTYDAFYAVAIAGLSLSHRSGKNIVAKLAQMSDANSVKKIAVGQNGVTSAITTLQQGGTIDLIGTSGPIDLDPASGDTVSAPIEVWSIDTTGATPKFKQDDIITPSW